MVKRACNIEEGQHAAVDFTLRAMRAQVICAG